MRNRTDYKNYILDLYNMVSQDILNLNESELNNGIWHIIDRYKHNYEFLQQEYQEYNTIRQLLDKFEKNDLFCFKYNCIEGCTKCIPSIQSEKYLPQVLCFDNNYINMYSIIGLIYDHLKNTNSVCYKYGYYKEKIIDENIKNYYIIITKVECPLFIMIGFEFSLPEDLYNKDNKLNSLETLNLLSFNRLKSNIEIIK